MCFFTGAGLLGALSNMIGLSGTSPGSPRETLRALNAELATWETLAQVGQRTHTMCGDAASLLIYVASILFCTIARASGPWLACLCYFALTAALHSAGPPCALDASVFSVASQSSPPLPAPTHSMCITSVLSRELFVFLALPRSAPLCMLGEPFPSGLRCCSRLVFCYIGH